uniref:Putative myosin class ii heavy chain n=1 Tax=Amblyomma aureolatum TaxID=187763 RepID=A0A1E1XFT8_9ACAR
MDTGKLIAHPSVRMRGSEHSFEPIECSSDKCTAQPVPHLHCPFCTKSSVFKDPRIVKAHYRVKHVDKGLYFAGLKMLRCSATCRISGSIKGEKKFRGPHWHCYKCKNGFCRRDEAMKHFETHFKMPQTTFQINIVQDVNEGMGLQSRLDSSTVEHSECHMSSASDISTDMDSNTAVAVTVDMTEESSAENPASPSTSETPTTVMIIQEDDTRSLSSDPGCMLKTREEDLTEKNIFLQKLLTEFKQQMDNLKARHTHSENAMQLEILSLRRQLEKKNTELEQLKKQQAELLSSKTPQLNSSLQKLLKAMQNQHAELLMQQIAQARNEAFQSALNELQNGTTILTTMENSSTAMLQQENNPLVAMVLNSTGTLGIPVSLATNSSPSVVCSPVKNLLQKLGTTGMPVMISGQQAFVQAQPGRSVQQAVGSQNLVLTLADTSDVSQDLVSSAQHGSTVVACTDLQYQLPTVTSDSKDDEEAVEECTS